MPYRPRYPVQASAEDHQRYRQASCLSEAVCVKRNYAEDHIGELVRQMLPMPVVMLVPQQLPRDDRRARSGRFDDTRGSV